MARDRRGRKGELARGLNLYACRKRETSIWSLRVTFSGSTTVRRLLTIEVNNQRRVIVQVRGHCNQPLTAMRGHRRMMLARDVLRDWARQRHLGIACSP